MYSCLVHTEECWTYFSRTFEKDMLIEHCNLYWNVKESLKLNPSEESKIKFKGIESQILIFGECLNHEEAFKVYYWYPSFLNGKSGNKIRIKEREFERVWLPRLTSDIMTEKRDTKFRMFISEHTRETAKSAERASLYLDRKNKRIKRMIPVGFQ